MLRLSLLIVILLPSISEGQMFLFRHLQDNKIKAQVATLIKEKPEQDVIRSNGNTIYVYLNKAYYNTEEYRLVKDLSEDNFSREKVRIRLQVDYGDLDSPQELIELERIKSKWAQLKKNVKFLETKEHISPCYKYSQYSDRAYDLVGEFYNLDGSVEKTKYPSQIIEKLSLELYLLNYYKNNYSTKQPFHLSSWTNSAKIIDIKHDSYTSGEETVRFSYINIDYLNKRIPLSRLIVFNITDEFGNSSSIKNETKFMSDADKFRIYVKYIKYLHNNTSIDYSEDIIDFEESLIREMYNTNYYPC